MEPHVGPLKEAVGEGEEDFHEEELVGHLELRQ